MERVRARVRGHGRSENHRPVAAERDAEGSPAEPGLRFSHRNQTSWRPRAVVRAWRGAAFLPEGSTRRGEKPGPNAGVRGGRGFIGDDVTEGTARPHEAIYEKLSSILRDVFDDDTIIATPELTAADVLGWDSFAHLRVIFTVEKVFGVSFSASQMSSLKNVGDLAALIDSKLSK
jgi:acyl carrier protein